MVLDDRIVESLLNNTFFIDFMHIELQQMIDSNPVIFSGPGTISQGKDGILHLKMYHRYVDLGKELALQFGDVTYGKILGNEHFFSLRAVDMKGRIWTAEKITVPGGFSTPAVGKVIETTVTDLVNEEARPKDGSIDNSHVFMAASGSYSIPCNELQKFPGGGTSLNTSVFTFNDINAKLRSSNNSLIINLTSAAENLTEYSGPLFLEAINIIFGKYVNPVCTSFAHGSARLTHIYSTPSRFPNSSLSNVIKHQHPWELTAFKDFIEKYTSAITTPFSELFGYWHKINRTWQASIDNAALAVTVGIEGILKNYFASYGLPEAKFIEEVEDAKQKIKKLELGARVKERLLSSLGQAKSSSPKSALYNLSRSGAFEEKLANDWVALRNMSAHSDTLNEEEIQVYIDKVHSCLSLFYRLLFLIIDYKNDFIDFNAENWGHTPLIIDDPIELPAEVLKKFEESKKTDTVSLDTIVGIAGDAAVEAVEAIEAVDKRVE